MSLYKPDQGIAGLPMFNIKDGDEAPPPSHHDGPDTERQAAEKVKPEVKRLRTEVAKLAYRAGPRGVTGWEAVVALGMEDHETSVRPRLTELTKEIHGCLLVRSQIRRRNAKGNSEAAYVHRDFAGEVVS